ncbi:hypothetical protein [Azohydromonas lata]|uniref:Uncharacterized protein n=1 Tax=Azohydromonas lata TaxID=45677 RepID=A0ABU5IBK4_9BURK|nr:hypothetical protein [Azohydromonas lata]MDZ5455930.1 hypothetical protein [Azohydromonas lata]
MNTTAYALDAATAAAALSRDDMLVDLVCFKWLMADLGCWVDVPRMRRDGAYASECAARGLLARSDVLRQRSRDLLALLHGGLPQPAQAGQARA